MLARRADGARFTGSLLELDEGLAADAEAFARARGLDGIDVVRADAGSADSYVGAVPADPVMMCGVFGNVTDEDLRGTVAVLPSLRAPGATVIWTRGRFSDGDLTRVIRGWFAEVAFECPAGRQVPGGYPPADGRAEPVPGRQHVLQVHPMRGLADRSTGAVGSSCPDPAEAQQRCGDLLGG